MTMAKRTFLDISQGLEAWDAEVDTNFDTCGRAFPIPLFEPSGGLFANLPAANQNDAGLAAFTDATAGKILALSDNSAWRKIGTQAADVVALTDNVGGSTSGTLAAIPDPADSPATADALRDDLVANTIPKIRDAISGLAAKVNLFRTNMRTSGEMA